MNFKRFAMASMALFVFIYLYEFVVHGILMANIYAETPNIWRNYSQMLNYVPFNIFIMALIAVWMTFIFTKFYRTGGSANGLKFGFYIGVLSGIQAAGAFYYLPISATLAFLWFATNFIETLLGGCLI